MELELLADDLVTKLGKLPSGNPNSISCANEAIVLCRDLLSIYKKEITTIGFVSIEDEINFFKHIKQIPLKELIYYSEVRSFEIQFPKVNRDAQRKHIKKKIKKLNRFFLFNMDFIQYVNSEHTHFDKEYYTRGFLNSFHIITSKFYFQDPDFCTPRDILLGKFNAYTTFLNYLEKRLLIVEKPNNGTKIDLNYSKKLHWPFGNTAYVELLYSLCLAGLTEHNNTSIVEISRRLQQIFDIEPKDIYNTRAEIGNRKNSRTLFLDRLASSLLTDLDKSDE